MIVASLLMPLSSCHGNRKRLSSNEESSFLITYSQKEIVIESIKKKGVVEHFFYKNGEYFASSDSILFFSTVKDTILNVLHTYKEIKSINDISSAPVGYQYVLFLTIAVDGNMTTFQSHKLADKLEKDMTKLDNVYKAIIHIEPYLK